MAGRRRNLDAILDADTEERQREARKLAVQNTRKLQDISKRYDGAHELIVEDRVFVREGDLIKIGGADMRKVQERRFVLMDDVLFWAKTRFLPRKKPYLVKNSVPLSDLEISDAPDTPRFSHLIRVVDTANDKVYHLMADNAETKRKWLRDLKSCAAGQHPGVFLIRGVYSKPTSAPTPAHTPPTRNRSPSDLGIRTLRSRFKTARSTGDLPLEPDGDDGQLSPAPHADLPPPLPDDDAELESILREVIGPFQEDLQEGAVVATTTTTAAVPARPPRAAPVRPPRPDVV